MKLATFFAVILLAAGALGIGAQQFENESEYYPKSFQIHRIYTLSKGYRIDYVTQNYKIGTFASIWWRTPPMRAGVCSAPEKITRISSRPPTPSPNSPCFDSR